MVSLDGSVAVVTGASRNLGRGIAHELGLAGGTVYVTGRSFGDVTTVADASGTVDGTADLVTAAGGEGIAVQCDHTDDTQVEALFSRIEDDHGHVDILVNDVWGGYEGYGDDADFTKRFWEQPLWRWEASTGSTACGRGIDEGPVPPASLTLRAPRLPRRCPILQPSSTCPTRIGST